MAELVVLEQEEEQEWTDTDQKIKDIILKYPECEYDAILQDAEWDVFYQLSPIRESLFNWYPFREGSEVLELSDGFGAITGLFCRTASKVVVLEASMRRAECIAKRYDMYDNLTIFAGRWGKEILDRTYDYIIVEKALNTAYEMEKIIEEVTPFLKETGRLLFVCENRFGMKYWCGVPDPVSHQPFAGVRGYSGCKMLTRKDLVNILEQNKMISDWNLYYPFPDYRLPQVIYSDCYLPKTSVRDRVIPYYLTQDRAGMVCLENEISDELIENEIFHVFSNSFMVECSKTHFVQEIIFAALSTDRGKEHGFATIITSYETVRKKIIYPEGRNSLELIYRNNQELLRHGVSCVEEIYRENAIEMPFIKGKSLIEYLKYLFFHKKEKVEEIFDGLYKIIQRSSEEVNFSECILKSKNVREDNAGIILRRAYIDMIPYNCFYIDGEFIFYDQEFVKEYYPAKYVLFRALRYTYIYIVSANDIIPLKYFVEKYELSELWQSFEREECKFIEENRNYKILAPFYRWAEISSEEIDENICKLADEGNNKIEKGVELISLCRQRYNLDKYKNNTQLNAVKEVQMDLLRKFISVCNDYNMAYCLFYGTLLGAVRHKGYIPWDDDIDVLMPRKDYDKLLEIAPEVFNVPYFLQSPESDPDCYYGGYSKLRNSNTTGIERRNRGHSCNQGIWIDIFPLDYVLKDEKGKKIQYEQIRFYQRLLYKKTYPKQRILWELSKQEEENYLHISRYYSRESLCKRLYDTITKCEGEYSDKVGVIARYWRGGAYTEYDEADFSFVVKAEFEDIEVYIPIGYENCLLKDYGEDYSIYPEEGKRKLGHDAIFDVTMSYIDYDEKNSYNNLGYYS